MSLSGVAGVGDQELAAQLLPHAALPGGDADVHGEASRASRANDPASMREGRPAAARRAMATDPTFPGREQQHRADHGGA